MIGKKIVFLMIILICSASFFMFGCTGSIVGVGDPHYRPGHSKGGPPP